MATAKKGYGSTSSRKMRFTCATAASITSGVTESPEMSSVIPGASTLPASPQRQEDVDTVDMQGTTADALLQIDLLQHR